MAKPNYGQERKNSSPAIYGIVQTETDTAATWSRSSSRGHGRTCGRGATQRGSTSKSSTGRGMISLRIMKLLQAWKLKVVEYEKGLIQQWPISRWATNGGPRLLCLWETKVWAYADICWQLLPFWHQLVVNDSSTITCNTRWLQLSRTHWWKRLLHRRLQGQMRRSSSTGMGQCHKFAYRLKTGWKE